MLGENGVIQMALSLTASDVRGGPDLVPWSPAECRAFGVECLKAPHTAHLSGLFTDDALAALIDTYPRQQLQAFTMGTDPERLTDLAPVDTAGVSGRSVLAAIRAGKIWFKLQRIDKHGAYGDLVNRLYDELEAKCAGFKPLAKSAVLIISSPGALVYFHADAKPNMIWHMRGQKKFTLYPNGHRTLISQEAMEDIFANVIDEEVPYRADFEKVAKVFTLNEGDALSWPQNTPHVVMAQGPLNVSISSFHETDDGIRRACVYGFNRLVRTVFGIHHLSVDDTGTLPAAKALAYRAVRKAGLVKPHHPNREYMASYRLDGAAAAGISPTGKPVRTEFR